MRSINDEDRPLERLHTRRALQTELATGNKTQGALAKKYGVTPQAISAFKNRWAAKIEEIRDNAADEFAGIEIARKANRLDAYQSLFDAAVEEGDYKLAARIQRNVAEEMGHLPSRMTINAQLGPQTHYVIEGVDAEDLK